MGKINTWIVLGAVCACLIISFGQLMFSDVETAGWGLHFSENGESPAGPVSAERLKDFDAAYMGDPAEKVIYLTFDAGYENGCTEKILDTLKQHNVPAAFFLCGNYLEKNADLVRRMAAEGHTVGNHTMHHPDMTRLSEGEFEKELTALSESYQQIVGKPMEKFYRPPQGVYSQANLEQAKAMGYKTLFWSLAYADWDNENQPEPEKAVQKLTDRIHNGAVVLLHSTSTTNARILDELLTKWEQMGYRFAQIEELFEG